MQILFDDTLTGASVAVTCMRKDMIRTMREYPADRFDFVGIVDGMEPVRLVPRSENIFRKVTFHHCVDII